MPNTVSTGNSTKPLNSTISSGHTPLIVYVKTVNSTENLCILFGWINRSWLYTVGIAWIEWYVLFVSNTSKQPWKQRQTDETTFRTRSVSTEILILGLCTIPIFKKVILCFCLHFNPPKYAFYSCSANGHFVQVRQSFLPCWAHY